MSKTDEEDATEVLPEADEPGNVGVSKAEKKKEKKEEKKKKKEEKKKDKEAKEEAKEEAKANAVEENAVEEAKANAVEEEKGTMENEADKTDEEDATEVLPEADEPGNVGVS